MKNLIIILWILILSGINSYSQKNTIITFYDESKNHTKEVYEVLNSDSSFYHGDYELYSESGKLLERGFYENNSKSGEWMKINEDGQLLYFGSYSNNQFTGFQFSWDEEEVISDYYQNSVSIEKDSLFVLQSINSIREKLLDSTLTFIGEEQDNLNKFLTESNTGDSSRTTYLIDNYNLLTHQGTRLIAIYNLFAESKAKLVSLIEEVESFLSSNSNIILIENIVELNKEMTDLLSNGNEIEIINGLIPLSDEFRISSQLILRNTIIREEINREIEKLSNVTINLPVDLYVTRQDHLNDRNSKLNKENDLVRRLETGIQLKQDIIDFTTELSSLSGIFTDITSMKNELANGYESKYPLIYSNVESDITNSQEEFASITEPKERLDLGNSIKDKISDYKNKFITLDSLHIFIESDYEPLKNTYLQQYPSIYSKEIKSLDISVINFNKLIIIDDKIKSGREICSRIKFYKTSIIEFGETDKAINERFPVIENEYKEKYREIHRSEVVVLKKVFKRYKLLSGAISKVETGNQIRSKIEELEINLETLGNQDLKIQTDFPLISSKYEAEFSALFKNDIKIFEKKIDFYKKATTSATRLAKGEEILSDIVELNEKYKEIKDQQAEINKKLNQVEGNYQVDFPQIYRSEIKDAKENINSYESEGRLNNKVTLGNIIIERFDALLDVYPEMKQENIKITTELPVLIDDYKDFFPTLYKLHIIDLIAVNKEYEGSGYMVEKTMLSKNIVKSIDDLTEKYTKFKNQIDIINGLYNDFNLYYQNRKPVAKILKKGNNVYKELRKSYDSEINLEEKMKRGKTIELMLNKLITMANEENSELNSKMRTVKVPEDFLSLLGIK